MSQTIDVTAVKPPEYPPYAVTADEWSDAVASLAKSLFEGKSYVPVMGWGDPGVAKTAGVDAAAKRLNCDLTVIHIVDSEPSEVGGLRWVVDGRVKRLEPEDLPLEDGKPHILFFDEVPQAPLMNKNVLARIILNRQVGPHRLGDQVYVCCAGNYARNKAGTSPMPSHLQARLTHFDLMVSKDAWAAHAAKAGFHPFVTAYINQQPQMLHLPNADQRASPNPRSWERVSEIEFSGISGQARKAAIAGTIGVEFGTHYIARSELLRQMPLPADVLKAPKTAPIPDDKTVLYGLVSALAAEVKPATMPALIEYTNRLVGDEEYMVLCIREARNRNPAVTSVKAYRDFLLTEKGQSLS